MQLLNMATIAGMACFACTSCSPDIRPMVRIAPPPPPPETPAETSTASAPGQDTYTPTSSPEVSTKGSLAERMLAVHNDVRANVTPAPKTPLTPLVWSEALARQAQAWADRCVFEHSKGETYGENNHSRSDHGSTAEQAALSFAREAAFYDYATNSCAAGKVCGHYTQMVWAGTKAVGCAVSHCETNSPFPGHSAWDFWVCQYSPPGNYRGQKPY